MLCDETFEATAVSLSTGQRKGEKAKKTQKAVRLFFLKLANHSSIALIRQEVSLQRNTISPFWNPPQKKEMVKRSNLAVLCRQSLHANFAVGTHPARHDGNLFVQLF